MLQASLDASGAYRARTRAGYHRQLRDHRPRTRRTHMAADPVSVACEIGSALQTLVTRSVNVFSPSVLAVGKIEAGTAADIIPESATRATLVEGVRRVAHRVSAAEHCVEQ